MAFNGGNKNDSNRCGDIDNPRIIFTLFPGKKPIEPTSLFDDDIKEILYSFTKTYIRTIKSAIDWNYKMTYVMGTTCYFGVDSDY